MKIHSMNELLDRGLGPVGTPKREEFEKEVNDAINKSKNNKNVEGLALYASKKVIADDIKSPFTGGRVFLVERMEEVMYHGEKYKVPVKKYQCEDTGIDFTTTELGDAAFNTLYQMYCSRHHIKPLAEDITKCY